MKKNLIFIILVSGALLSLKAQDDPFEVGFQFGLSWEMCQPTLESTPPYSDIFNSLNSTSLPGLTTGLMLRYRIAPSFFLRTIPAITLIQNQLDYDLNSGTTETYKGDAALMTIPLQAQYYFPGSKTRPTLFAGARYLVNIGQNKNNPPLFNDLKGSDIALEGGLGVEFSSPTKKGMLYILPELRYSHGLRNLASDSEDLYHDALASFTRSRLVLSVTFYSGS